jgi:anti-sigma regulatory factor (Ser/Thr protein kinase)
MSFAIWNDIALVGGANEALESFLRHWEVDPDVVCCAVLALEEAVTNIIRYAYADVRRHEILIEASIGKAEVVLRITDDGKEFDILAATPPHMHKPIDERPPGGLGIHLLRSIARRIEYERAEGKNRLLLCIAFDT